ncbi:MAG: 16S rRNA (cytidine(1402)-2'-O)-methyltransferase [Bacteroidia bacterium]|nr:16S rRNA (cytidine(1402)-2'-O)-methyltransferase [Bacteroidia bacterium]
MPGKLILVPTPIGNLKDITLRALEALKSCDIILAEDTRNTGQLLKLYEIDKPLQSYHAHNEHDKYKDVLNQLQAGKIMCLVTDAGTPGISDPGFLIVRECLKNQLDIECLPGATAFVPALVKSGLPSDRFCFEGFLPVKKGRKTRLDQLKNETRTMLFYESPYKILGTLEDFIEYFGADRQVSVSREITKLYEETINGTLEEVFQHFKIKAPKGEFVIALEGNKNE